MSNFHAHKRLLIGFIIVLILIPTTSIVLSKRLNQSAQSSQSYDRTQTQSTEIPAVSPIKDLLKNLQGGGNATSSSSQPNLGPTLKLALALEGRPSSDQHTKLFVGIVEGTNVLSNPQYLLSFNIDLPPSGQYSNISLVGLTQSQTYTAVLKGATQIATSSAFIMGYNGATLNSGSPISVSSGDLNQDNIIDQSDLDIINKAYGSTPKSASWNSSADLNLDGIVNLIDTSIVSRNQGKIGATGKWYSTTASKSARLAPEAERATLITPPNLGGEAGGTVLSDPERPAGVEGEPKGHWEWFPGN